MTCPDTAPDPRLDPRLDPRTDCDPEPEPIRPPPSPRVAPGLSVCQTPPLPPPPPPPRLSAAARPAPAPLRPLVPPLVMVLVLLVAPAAALTQCRREWVPHDQRLLVRCRVASLSAELDPAPLRLQSHETVRGLHLVCVETGLPHGPLLPGAFRLFPHLEELRIEQCLIPELSRASLDGLHKLKNLTFRTNGVEWSTAATLRLYPDTFRAMTRLELLDLGGNNFWSLPAGIFCPLAQLLTLNLTNNRLGDLTNISLSSAGGAPCPLPVRELDVSGNQLVSLHAGHFPGLPRLTRLLLDRNELSELGDGLLRVLPALQVLNVSSNRLSALPPEAFRGAAALAEIHLQHNRLRVMAPGVFAGLERLLVLDLSHNRLSDDWVNSDTLAQLPGLVLLRLAHNNVSRVDAAMFESMQNLRVLDLDSNALETLPSGAFAQLGALTELGLSQNRLARLPVGALDGLESLTSLSLRGNRLVEIDDDVLAAAPRLRTLDLADNRLKRVPPALGRLGSLKSLDIGGNLIESVDNASLSVLPELFALQMEGNQISDLSDVHFGNLTKLRALNLARNELSSLPSAVFDNLSNLQMLRLDSNQLTSLRGALTGLDSLKWLNASNNRLTTFDYADIPRGLEWLDLHGNALTELENAHELEKDLRLKTLDVSFNRITTLSPFQLPDMLETLIAHDNAITQVYPYTFFRKHNISRVDLFANQISTIDINAFRLNLATDRLRPEFYVGGNPVTCDCRLQWLGELNSNNDSSQYPRLMDLESLFCRLAFNVQRDYMPLVEVPHSQFLCAYTSHCATLCQCCQFDACDCEMTCPTNCTCYHTADWSGNIVDCTAAGHQTLPEHIPMDATELYLDGNHLPRLSSHAFIGRQHLLVLYLNDSRVRTVTNRTFNGLTSLQVLHLERNDLARLHGFEFDTLLLLRELYLHDNVIASIDNRTFTPLVSLQVLRLDGNRLVRFAPLQLTRHAHLVSVNVSANQWTCACDFLETFREWLEATKSAVVASETLRCFPNETSTAVPRAILGHNATACHFINNTIATQVYQRRSAGDYAFIAAVSVLALVAVVVAVVVYIFWHEMRVLAYAKYGVRMFTGARAEAESDKLFDAFVSYSAKDEPFVVDVLARALETDEPSFRLCLHHRDLAVRAYVADTIVHAIESSRRTVVVLSDHFVRAEWSRCEVKSALHQALSGRQGRLIVIIVGAVPTRELDPDLRLYLKTSPVLHWGDTLFWEKLKFELPDVRRARREEPPEYEYPMAVHI
ncbi:toll-like receptor Tollo [Amphibalanus amphitrite]|uniref:toll-like receptor Tollo n=1 Tax=Amphibalanus amphitrite TaxID=1232801 RepID=UPI001C91F29F|nr:toll-like receptor Tollo [Amphibalanus amphitrite]